VMWSASEGDYRILKSWHPEAIKLNEPIVLAGRALTPGELYRRETMLITVAKAPAVMIRRLE